MSKARQFERLPKKTEREDLPQLATTYYVFVHKKLFTDFSLQ
jgi:hypothetical protein